MQYLKKAVFLLVLSITFPQIAFANWTLWPTPNMTLDTPDIEVDQSNFNAANGSQGGHAIGQSFTATSDHIYRLKFYMQSRDDERPTELSIWSWIDTNRNGVAENNEYLASVTNAEPIYTTQINLPGPDQARQVNVYPNLDVEPGVLYYFEIGTPGQLGTNNNISESFVQYARTEPDLYTEGDIRINGSFRIGETWDMIFSVYSEAGDELDIGECDDGSIPPCTSDVTPWFAPVSAEASDRTFYSNLVNEMGNVFFRNLNPGNAPNTAIAKAFAYRKNGDETDALNALEAFRVMIENRTPTTRTGFEAIERPGFAYRWILDSPSLTTDDHRLIKTLLLDMGSEFFNNNRELGLNNRVLGGILSLKLVTDLIQADEFADLSNVNCAEYCSLFQTSLTSADHAAWQQFADNNWALLKQEWLLEDEATHYHSLSWQYILELIELYDYQDEAWQTPAFLALVENTATTVLPTGAISVFGDTRGVGHNFAGLVFLFETAATQLNNQHYKFLARLVSDFRIKYFDTATFRDRAAWRQVLGEEFIALANAYFIANEEIEPVQDTNRPDALFTTRRELDRRLISERRIGTPEGLGLFFDVLPNFINDKLILRSGKNPDDMYLTLSLAGGWQSHKHEDIGSILSFGNNGSIILSSAGNFDRRVQDHNTVAITHYRNGQIDDDARPREATVERLDEFNDTILANIQWQDIHGHSVELGRNIFFVKNKFVWFRDYAQAPIDMNMRAGSVWHSEHMTNPNDNWFSLFNRRPRGIAPGRFFNPEQYGLLYFFDRENYQYTNFDIDYIDAGRTDPHSSENLTTQSYQGDWVAGERRWFDSFLVPHSTPDEAANIVANIQSLYDNGTAVAATVTIDDQQWLLIDNPNQELIEIPELETDARLAVLSFDTEQASNSGGSSASSSVNLLIENASVFNFSDHGANLHFNCSSGIAPLTGEFDTNGLTAETNCLESTAIPAINFYLQTIFGFILLVVLYSYKTTIFPRYRAR